MTDLEQTILQELEALSAERQANVLTYIRFLKSGLADNPYDVEQRFRQSWQQVRERSAALAISEADIEAEIRAVRDEK